MHVFTWCRLFFLTNILEKKEREYKFFHEVVAKLLQVFVSSPSSNAMNDLHAGSRVV